MAAMNMNQEQFEQAIREEKPVLVDFWAPWCSQVDHGDVLHGRGCQQQGEDSRRAAPGGWARVRMGLHHGRGIRQIGRASCRERV